MERTAAVTVNISLEDIRKVASDAIVVAIFEDVRPLKGFAGQLDWLLCGSLSNVLLTKRMTGSLGDVALFTSREKVPSPKIFMMGLGPRSEFSRSTLRAAAKTAASSLVGARAAQAAMELLLPPDTDPETCISVLQEGLEEGAGGRSLSVTLIAPDKESYERLSRSVKA